MKMKNIQETASRVEFTNQKYELNATGVIKRRGIRQMRMQSKLLSSTNSIISSGFVTLTSTIKE